MTRRLRHVWVTRPEPGASRTADRLSQLGFDVFVQPLTEIVGLDVDAASLSACDVLVFTSANGARFFPVDAVQQNARKPVFAVGAATASAVRMLGFDNVITGPGDADALVEMLATQTNEGTVIAYVAGRQRTGSLENGLADIGRATHIVEAYDIEKVSQITYENRSFFQANQASAVLLYSATTVDALAALIANEASCQNYEKTHFIAISTRVAAVLEAALDVHCHIAESPDDDAMIDALMALDSHLSG